MSKSSINLLSFKFKCDYYSSGFSNDFDVVPIDDTINIFKRYNLQIIKIGNTYNLCWLTKNIDDVKQFFNKVFKDITIEFYVYVKNKNIYNYCDLDINTYYNYSNVKNTSNLSLKKSDNAGSKIHSSKLFGILNLNLSLLKFGEENNYFFDIPVIESYWGVQIEDNSNFEVLSINIGEDKYKFIKSSDLKGYYLSEKSIEFKENFKVNVFAKIKVNKKIIDVPFIPPKVFSKKNNGKYISIIDIKI